MLEKYNNARWEWQTLIAMIACYSIWLFATFNYIFVLENFGWVGVIAMLFGIVSIITAFHTSLQHEVVHGHPTPYRWLNESLIFPSLIFVYPFRRYKELHLKHHIDGNLTDPYDDPESYYWAESDYHKLNKMMALALKLNNSFVGRMVLGPFLGLYGFYRTEIIGLTNNAPRIRLAWILHIIGVIPVWFWITQICAIPFWLYATVVIYPAVSWILIRSFAEHLASQSIGARTAIVEGQGFFALLFLNNSFHMVHHAHPNVAWYNLPKLYRERKSVYLTANENFVFQGYWKIIRRYAFRQKQSVVHPILRSDSDATK